MNENSKDSGLRECSQCGAPTDYENEILCWACRHKEEEQYIEMQACPLGGYPSGVACQEALEIGACSQECLGGRI